MKYERNGQTIIATGEQGEEVMAYWSRQGERVTVVSTVSLNERNGDDDALHIQRVATHIEECLWRETLASDTGQYRITPIPTDQGRANGMYKEEEGDMFLGVCDETYVSGYLRVSVRPFAPPSLHQRTGVPTFFCICRSKDMIKTIGDLTLTIDCTRLQTAPAQPTAAAAADGGDVAYTVEYDRDWTWVRFPEKPPRELLDAINGNGMGFRWSKRRNAWYATRPVPQDEIAQSPRQSRLRTDRTVQKCEREGSGVARRRAHRRPGGSPARKRGPDAGAD